MANKQINQYTKVRTGATIKDDDFIDVDSTEDLGVTFESAKLSIFNFISYLRTKILTLYNSDGNLTGNRIITSTGFSTTFFGGDLIVKMKDLISSYSFKIKDSFGVVKAEIGYDNSISEAFLNVNGNATIDNANFSATTDSLIFGKDNLSHKNAETTYGKKAGEGNAGINLTSIGYRAGEGNLSSDVIALGGFAGIGNAKNQSLIIYNKTLPSYTDRATAVASLTLANGCVAGNYYLYYNLSNFSIEAVIL